MDRQPCSLCHQPWRLHVTIPGCLYVYCLEDRGGFTRAHASSPCTKCQEFLRVQVLAVDFEAQLKCDLCDRMVNEPKKPLGTCRQHHYCTQCSSAIHANPSKISCTQCKPIRQIPKPTTKCYRCPSTSASISMPCRHSFCISCYGRFVYYVVNQFKTDIRRPDSHKGQARSFGCPEKCASSNCVFSAKDIAQQTGCALETETQALLNRYYFYFDGVTCSFRRCTSCSEVVGVYTQNQWQCDNCSKCFYCRASTHTNNGCNSAASGTFQIPKR